MGKENRPPRWQEGSREFEIVLPADDDGESGKPESVRFKFKWKVFGTTRPMTARDQTRGEVAEAREKLSRARKALDRGEEFKRPGRNDLDAAFTHAVRAWCRTHLRCKDARTDNGTWLSAFVAKAPEHLVQLTAPALRRNRDGGGGYSSPEEMVSGLQASVNALLEAASSPPRNRRRFPAHLRVCRTPRRPRVKPGSWIDTGRYRPALLLEMMRDPPHIMKLSYGDEIDENFAPHITKWRPVRKRKRIPSLKDIFSEGDWIRNPYSGYGRILAVRNSTMDIDYRGRVATRVPQGLSRLEKVSDPGPADIRPVSERFPPGTWIERHGFGQGVVLAVEDDVLSVFSVYRVVRIFESNDGEGPVIWKSARDPVDLRSPWGRRWAWWWLHADISGEPVCGCCGYPNFGPGSGSWFSARECVVCGYPDFGNGIENDGEPCVFRAEGVWRHRNAWDFPEPDDPELVPDEPSDEEWEKSGYSLSEARNNYDELGVMFRPDDPNALSTGKLTALRHSLTRLFDETMSEPSRWHTGHQEAVTQIMEQALAILPRERR